VDTSVRSFGCLHALVRVVSASDSSHVRPIEPALASCALDGQALNAHAGYCGITGSTSVNAPVVRRDTWYASATCSGDVSSFMATTPSGTCVGRESYTCSADGHSVVVKQYSMPGCGLVDLVSTSVRPSGACVTFQAAPGSVKASRKYYCNGAAALSATRTPTHLPTPTRSGSLNPRALKVGRSEEQRCVPVKRESSHHCCLSFPQVTLDVWDASQSCYPALPTTSTSIVNGDCFKVSTAP
jgi:hypothetical protein